MGTLNYNIKHCSDCIHYETIPPFMFCKILQKRITARKKPCKNFAKN